MKALILESKDTLITREVPPPIAGTEETVISVELTGIGGSEYLALANPGIRSLPHAMGHGIVGKNPDGSLTAVYPLSGCGICSFCRSNKTQLCDEWALIGVHSDGGFQQSLAVPTNSIVDLPQTISAQQAVFIEPFANSINAWKTASPQPGQSIAIIGAGSLGLGISACAANDGIADVSIAETSEARREAAASFNGFKSDISLNGTYDIVFDTVGSETSRNEAIAITDKGGKCIFLGFATPIQSLNFIEFTRHQKQFFGSFVYSREQFRAAIELVRKCKDEWVHEIGFEEVEEYLRQFQNGNFKMVKLALRPNKTDL